MLDSTPHSLLLLPPLPATVTPTKLKAAYRAPVTACLKALSHPGNSKTEVLEILVAAPSVSGSLRHPRSSLFKEVEQIIAGLYGLITIVAAQNSIEVDAPGGVEARIILLAHDPSSREITGGVIVDLDTFARSRRQWKHIFALGVEQGKNLLASYKGAVESTGRAISGQIHLVDGGNTVGPTSDSSSLPSSAASHTVAAVGGTFDHLHAGHKLLLTATALILQPSTNGDNSLRRLIVGITGDELLKNKKYAEHLESWQQRQNSVIQFLKTILSFPKSEGLDDDVEIKSYNEPVVNGRAIHTYFKHARIRIECVEIQDPFGPTITDESVTALVVSAETRGGGAAVNTEREKKGWNTLEVFEVDVIDGEENSESAKNENDFAAKISSTAIRKRRAEKSGHGPSL